MWWYFYLFCVSIHDIRINVVISSIMVMYVTLLVDVFPSSIYVFAILFMAIFSSMFLFAMMLVIVLPSCMLMDIMLVLLQLNWSTIISIICASTHGIVSFPFLYVASTSLYICCAKGGCWWCSHYYLSCFLLLPTLTFHFEVRFFFFLFFWLYMFWLMFPWLLFVYFCICIYTCIFVLYVLILYFKLFLGG